MFGRLLCYLSPMLKDINISKRKFVLYVGMGILHPDLIKTFFLISKNTFTHTHTSANISQKARD